MMGRNGQAAVKVLIGSLILCIVLIVSRLDGKSLELGNQLSRQLSHVLPFAIVSDVKPENGGSSLTGWRRQEFLGKMKTETTKLQHQHITRDEVKDVFLKMSELRREYNMIEDLPASMSQGEILDEKIELFSGNAQKYHSMCVEAYANSSQTNSNINDIASDLEANCISEVSDQEKCIRGKQHLDIVQPILEDDVVTSGPRFCAFIVDDIALFDDEPQCTQVIVLINAKYLVDTKTQAQWPGVIKDSAFDDAFLKACAYEGAAQTDCRSRLQTVKALPRIGKDSSTLNDFLGKFCHASGYPLTYADATMKTHQSTSRGKLATMLKEAAQHAQRKKKQLEVPDWVKGRTNEWGNEACCNDDDCSNEFHKCELPFCEVSNANPCICGWGVYEGACAPPTVDVCCDENARTVDTTVAASWGFQGSYATTKGSGFVSWNGDTCTYKAAYFDSICASVDFDDPGDILPSVQVGVVWGTFTNYDYIAGSSIVKGGSGCLIGCIGGGLIYDLSNNKIGSYVEAGVALDFGINFETAYCFTFGPNGENTLTYEVDCGNDDCFSSQMTVKLQDGSSVFMNEVKVGEMVQTMKDNGDVAFEPFLGFYHMHHTKLAEFLSIVHGEASKNVLEVTKRHLVYVKTPDGLHSIAAGDLEPGMMLVMPNGDDGNSVTSRIISIGRVWREGIYSPFTYSSKLVVGNVLVSSYTILPGLQKGKYYMTTADAFTFLFRMRRWILASLGFTWEDPEKEVLFFMKCWPPLYKIWIFMSKTIPKSIGSLHEMAVYMLQHMS